MGQDNTEYSELSDFHNNTLRSIYNQHVVDLGEIALGHLSGLKHSAPDEFVTKLGDTEQFVNLQLRRTEQKVAQNLGISYGEVQRLLSRDERKIFSQTERDASRYGVGYAVNRHLRDASHQDVAQAMHAGVDRKVFEKLQSDASRYGVGYAVNRHLRDASHQDVADKMGAYFGDTNTKSTYHGSSPRSERHEDKSYSDGRTKAEARPKSKPPKIPAKEIVDPIIRKVIDPGSLKSLQLENPDAVLKVINTIRLMRDKEPGITDRQIYLRYRRAIENHDPDPTLVRSCQILQNLMGGNINSKLPF